MSPPLGLSPHAGTQSVLHAVSHGDGLLLGLEGDDGDHGAEDLLLDHTSGGAKVGDDGGLEVVAILVAWDHLTSTTDEDGAPFLLGEVDVVLDLAQVLAAHEGSQVGPVVGGKSYFQLLGLIVH